MYSQYQYRCSQGGGGGVHDGGQIMTPPSKGISASDLHYVTKLWFIYISNPKERLVKVQRKERHVWGRRTKHGWRKGTRVDEGARKRGLPIECFVGGGGGVKETKGRKKHSTNKKGYPSQTHPHWSAPPANSKTCLRSCLIQVSQP